MSGPITAIIFADPVSALLSASAIRAAAAVQEGYEHAAALHMQNQARADASRATQHAANLQGQGAQEAAAREAEAGFDQLIALAEQVGVAAQVRATRPVRPQAGDVIALAAYVRGLQQLAGELKSILLTEAARQMGDSTDQRSDFDSAVFAVASASETVSQRLLARIAHMGVVPEEIARIARELEIALPGERTDLLTVELRRRIQEHIEATQKQLVQEATSTIVEQSLKDLGYQVEEVGNTLFVEGGVVHFRKQGWGNYMVRMRIDAKAETANFNVIRAVEAGNNERSVLDHIAEDRWCSEFPALLSALEARGVRLNVTRRLEAGELPVQLVDAGKLPKFAEDDEAVSTAKPRAREIK